MRNKNILIVYAHPEPKSLNGSLKEFTVEVLEKLVTVSRCLIFTRCNGRQWWMPMTFF